MRLKNIPPAQLTEQQRPLFDTISESIAAHLKGFVTSRDDGALIGPFNNLLHFPELGTSAWSLFKALADQSKLPTPVRELTILLTGAKLGASYESYSHETVALSARRHEHSWNRSRKGKRASFRNTIARKLLP